MTGTLAPAWRLARGLALSGDPRQRWRQVSLVATGLLVTLSLLLAASTIWRGAISSGHLEARRPLLASSSSDTAAWWVKTMPVLPGGLGQVPVHWIEPVAGHEDDPALVPPGLSRLPEPGSVVLSPGLVRAGLSADDLGLKASDAGHGVGGTIGDAGLASRSEGFAIARPVAGQHLARETATAVRGYGVGASESRVPWAETTLDIPMRWPGVGGSLALLVVPALFMLLGSARGLSPLLRRRGAVLWSLGVSRTALRLVAALEAGVLVLAGGLLGWALFLLLVWRRTTLPLVDAVYLPGAHLPLAATLPLLLLTPLLAAAAAASAPFERERRGRVRLRGLVRVVPLAAGLVLMALCLPLSTLLGGRTNADLGFMLLAGGGIVTMLSLPLALPVLSGLLSRSLEGATRPSLWLAARRVALGPARLSRTAALVGLMVFVLNAEVALYEGTREGPPQAARGGDRSVWLVAADDMPETFVDDTIARAEAAGGMGVRLGEPTMFPSCEHAATFFGVEVDEVGCHAAPSGRLRGMSLRVGVPPEKPARLSNRAVVISGPSTWHETDVLRAAAGATAAQPLRILGRDRDFVHPGSDWFRAGMIASSALILMGLLRALGDRAVESAADQSALARAGLHPREAAATSTQATLLPVLIAVPVGVVAAVLFAIEGASAGYTTTNLLLMGGATLGVLAVCLAVILGAAGLEQRLGEQRGR